MKILTEKGIREVISISLDDRYDDKFLIVAEWFEYITDGCFTMIKKPIAYFPIRSECGDDDKHRARDTFDEITRDIIEEDMPKIFEQYTNCHSILVK